MTDVSANTSSSTDTGLPALLLASTSPRRRELLSQAGLTFQVVSPGPSGGVDESPLAGEAVAHYVARVARDKALAGQTEAQRLGLPAWPVLGADTTVTLDGRILGKPADAAEATAMLESLSGRTHQVLTALCLVGRHGERAVTSVSEVRFRALSAVEVAAYVGSGEPYDKAGGYGIQGRGALLIEHLSGSYSGVMGLPLHELGELLRALAPLETP